MAEGDAVHRLARRLDLQLRGVVVVSAEARTSRINPMPLVGLKFAEVKPLGKHLLMRLYGSQQFTLHSHLRMQGQWSVLGADKCLPGNIDDQARLKLRLEDGRTLVAVNMPVLEIVETAQESDVVGHVGPDVLADDFELVSALRLQHEPTVPAVEALLDQRNVSGLGNLWVVEVLFLRGVHPDTPIAKVDVIAMITLAQKMMRYSRDVAPGMITTGDRRKGRTHWVYGRASKPCLRCRTLIEFRNGDGSAYHREMWWCPSCQPGDL